MPKRTFQPNKRKRKRAHGFRARMQTSGGRKVIKARHNKGRKMLTRDKWVEDNWAKKHYIQG